MKPAGDVRDSATELTAAKFAAKICAGEMSESDQRALEGWLAEDPRHIHEYEAMLDAWEVVGVCASDAPVGSSANETAHPPTFGAGMSRYRIAAGIAVFAVAVGAAVVGWDRYRTTAPQAAAYETAVGERNVISLADGSSVTLNTATRLLVDFSDKKRRLVLEFGEAFFDIATDPAIPLTVEAGNRVISVVGTAFNVHRDDSAVAVAIMEGLVSVNRADTAAAPDSGVASSRVPAVTKGANDHTVLLRQGSGATFSAHGNEITPLSALAVQRTQDWRLGIVKFDNEPLSKVVSELNRYNTRQIVIDDMRVADIPVSGVFRLDDIERVLEGIESALPVDVVRNADSYVVVGRESMPPIRGVTPRADPHR